MKDQIINIPEVARRYKYGDRAKEILDQLEKHAYAKALKIPLVDGAQLEILQAAITREARRRKRHGKTKKDGDSLLVWVDSLT